MGTRERLLDGAVDYVAANGITDVTLRGLASELGTSHRMLLYHFGSRENLLVEVVRRVERRQRDELATLEPGATAAEITRRFWARLSDPALAPNERLFFEIYGQALQGKPGTTALLEGIVDSWLEPSTELLRRLGFPADAAPAQARLGLAVVRGLLLDLLATGDREGCTEALEQFIRLGESYLRDASGR